ncbi:MAG TPA: DUF4129 domain-containing protein [Pyrinomonadaceae bacterium]|nr:DUF4129 domain-containing protein [Pyrinomonadaceae bacterium]
MKNGKLTKLAKILVFTLVFSVSAFAVDLSEYRSQIKNAREELEYLLNHDESETEADIRAEEREKLANVRAALKPTEIVELQGARFEADHGWILARLKAFEEEPLLARRQTIVGEIVNRLEAVEAKLDELEKQEISNRAKDEDKQKLEEILRRAEYQKPEEKEKTWLEKSIDSFFTWLSELFPKSPPIKESEQMQARPFSLLLQLLLYAVVLGIIGFLLYRFAPFLRQRFFNREKAEKKERVILGETLAADETSHNLFSEAERLAREGNLRAAIRKGYIAFLCELSDRKIIGLANHKTNRDYLRDVRKRPEIYRNMNALTDSFETVWYGFGKAEAEDWEKFRQKYNETVSGKQ